MSHTTSICSPPPCAEYDTALFWLNRHPSQVKRLPASQATHLKERAGFPGTHSRISPGSPAPLVSRSHLGSPIHLVLHTHLHAHTLYW